MVLRVGWVRTSKFKAINLNQEGKTQFGTTICTKSNNKEATLVCKIWLGKIPTVRWARLILHNPKKKIILTGLGEVLIVGWVRTRIRENLAQ